MNHARADQVVVDEAVRDTARAVWEFDGARAWLERARRHRMDPLSAEVWALDTGFTHVLLVRHRVRGWVPPGGKAEVGESPRAAAARELLEETGVRADLLPEPAAVAVRSYRADWSATLGLSYAAVVDRGVALVAERGQPARWFSLEERWDSVFPADRSRIRDHAQLLASGRTAVVR
ncbi:NUDIX domain-containing protein [Streptomyces sp. NPDC057552]|uniref:NUDIX domain-containing protein n=1 Tax=Streptomyces sp. NPDC057552 TaxID=3350537 RepID=UPI0036CCB2B6